MSHVLFFFSPSLSFFPFFLYRDTSIRPIDLLTLRSLSGRRNVNMQIVIHLREKQMLTVKLLSPDNPSSDPLYHVDKYKSRRISRSALDQTYANKQHEFIILAEYA